MLNYGVNFVELQQFLSPPTTKTQLSQLGTQTRSQEEHIHDICGQEKQNWKNLSSTWYKFRRKSGPVGKDLFKEVPWNFAEAFNTLCTFPGLFGLITGRCGRILLFIWLLLDQCEHQKFLVLNVFNGPHWWFLRKILLMFCLSRVFSRNLSCNSDAVGY